MKLHTAMTVSLITTTLLFSCNKTLDDSNYTVDSTNEAAQQVGDVAASIDESGGATSGAITTNEINSYQKTFARFINKDFSAPRALFSIAVPQAQAEACNVVNFGTCTSGTRTKTFNSCSSNGGGTISGNIILAYAGTHTNLCNISSASDSVSRAPNFTISGLRGATFKVATVGIGQTLTRVGAGSFTLTNAGIRRTFVTPKGTTKLDITASTGSAVTITGDARNTRNMNGGIILIKDNLTDVTCTLTPNNMAWTSSCNCPTSGSMSGTCSDSSTFAVAFNSTCGESTVTKSGVDTTVTLDRCQQ